MSRRARCVLGMTLLTVLFGVGLTLQHIGLYGWALFALLPTLAGGVASWWADPATGKRAAGIGALAVFLGSLLFLLLGVEGLICIAMALVLGAPLGALG